MANINADYSELNYIKIFGKDWFLETGDNYENPETWFLKTFPKRPEGIMVFGDVVNDDYYHRVREQERCLRENEKARERRMARKLVSAKHSEDGRGG